MRAGAGEGTSGGGEAGRGIQESGGEHSPSAVGGEEAGGCEGARVRARAPGEEARRATSATLFEENKKIKKTREKSKNIFINFFKNLILI